MALDEGDKAICGEIAERIIEKVMKRIMPQHVASCPHGKTMLKNKMFLVGCIVGTSIAGGAGGASVVIAFVKIFSGN